jgi:8-oxo-dGTP diphosphatase
MNTYVHTPSAGGIVIHEGNILIITSALRGSVDLPKGTIEKGESIELTAIREIEEETGYRVRIIRDIGSLTYDFPRDASSMWRKTVSYFLMELADQDEPVKNLQEGEDFENEWVSPEEAISRLTYDDTREMVRRIARAFEAA